MNSRLKTNQGQPPSPGVGHNGLGLQINGSLIMMVT